MDLTDKWVPLKLIFFVLNHQKNGQMGRNSFFWILSLKQNFNLYAQILHRSLTTNEISIGFTKRGRTHLVIPCPKNNKKLEEKLFLVFQSSSFKTDLNKKHYFFFFFLRQTGPQELNPLQCLQTLLQILIPVSNTDILTPGLVGDQIETVAW